MKKFLTFFEICALVTIARPLLAGMALIAGLAGAPLSLWAQACAITVNNNGTTVPAVTTAGTVICITANNYTRDITIDAANCTVNFSGSTYSGSLSVTSNGAGCTINNNSGSTISGSSNTISGATTINNQSGATWTGNFYSGVAAGSTINNAGSWAPGGQQFTPLNGITINNTGTWNAVSYGVSGNPVTITNAGAWTNQLGGISTNLTLTNNAGATWSQPITGSGAVNLTLTNNGTWTGNITFPTGTNTFSNRAGATATIATTAFDGSTTISNGSNGGTPTLTFSGNITPTAGVTIVNYAGTVNTNSGITSAGTIDNRAAWNASSFASSGSVTNSSTGTIRPTASYANSGGSTTNNGYINLTNSGATYTNSGGATTNNGTITVASGYTNSGGTTTNAARRNITATTYSISGGTFTNNGTATAITSFANAGGTVANNAGATIATPTYTNQGATTNSGTLNPTGDFINSSGTGNVVTINSAINPGGGYINRGITHNNGSIQAGTFVLNENSGATINNNTSATLTTSTYFLNRAVLVNNSTITVGSYFTAESSGNITNGSSGVLVVNTDFTNNSPFTNNGRIYQTSPGGLFRHLNGASFTNAGYVEIAGNFTNEGNVNGAASGPSGAFRVAGVSTNSGWSFGSSGALDFCDTTPGGAPVGFNSNSGGIGGAVTNCAMLPRPLPVELTRFSATAANGRVLLSWATASEKNNRHFLIERSADGREFTAIASVPGQGTTAAPTSYQATDEQPLKGLSYYRLHQVDADGTASFSPVAAVQITTALAIGLALYPNPVADQTQLDLRAWPSGAATVQVRAVSGKVALTMLARGGEKQALDLHTLPGGAYLLTVRTAGQQRTQRLLKL